jgi:hypothetical protein
LEPFDTITDETAFWFTNRIVEKNWSHEKCICTGWIPARSPRPAYGSPAPVKVVLKMSLALRAGVSVCGSTWTVLVEPKTWLVRILRRDCWPEIFYRLSSYIVSGRKLLLFETARIAEWL